MMNLTRLTAGALKERISAANNKNGLHKIFITCYII